METTEKPCRRVGNFTLGVSLILTGLALLLHFFLPGFDLLRALSLAPLILISLGGEVLFYNLRPQRFRLNLLSILLCLALTGAALLASLAGTCEVTRAQYEKRADRYLTAAYTEALEGLDADHIQVTLSLDRRSPFRPYEDEELLGGHFVTVSVRFSRQFDDAEDFAAHCQAAARRVDGYAATQLILHMEAPFDGPDRTRAVLHSSHYDMVHMTPADLAPTVQFL